MKGDRNKQLRRKSMQGTVYLALGLIAAVAFVATGFVWLATAAVIFCVLGIFLLYRVGKSLS